jgi:hydrogenase expression/formation protein HypE
MCGATPLFLSVALILEEGFPMEHLWRLIQSMRKAADRAGVVLCTGDTKVVEKGKGDQIFISTSGIGLIEKNRTIGPQNTEVGGRILLSGNIGVHGIAIMSVREGLEFETEMRSDTAPLHELVKAMFAASENVHVLRDPTRGGVASALNEIAKAAQVGMSLIEETIPVTDEVQGACEILGLDPLYVANEGKLIALVPAHELRRHRIKQYDKTKKHSLRCMQVFSRDLNSDIEACSVVGSQNYIRSKWTHSSSPQR